MIFLGLVLCALVGLSFGPLGYGSQQVSSHRVSERQLGEPAVQSQASSQPPAPASTAVKDANSGIYVCDMPRLNRCREYLPSFRAIKDVKTDMCERWELGRCPAENLVGVCERPIGFRQFFYAPVTEAEAKAMCDTGAFRTPGQFLGNSPKR